MYLFSLHSPIAFPTSLVLESGSLGSHSQAANDDDDQYDAGDFDHQYFVDYDVAEYDIYYDKIDRYDADNDDAQRIFLLYIDRSAKIVSAFSRNSHPNTITQLQETNP